MTVRVCVILLMLAQAIACPFLHCGECQGSCAFRCVETDHQDDGCSETESSVESHSHQTASSHLTASSKPLGNLPNVPECPDHDGAIDCLCDGAIRAEQVKCPDATAFGLFLVLPDGFYSEALLSQAIESRRLACIGSVHFPPLTTGRRICALTQTWLL